MKHSHPFFSIVLFISLFLQIAASQERDTTKVDDEIFNFHRKYERVKLGGAGGFTPSYLLLDTKELNKFIGANNGEKLTESGMMMYGGEGYAYIMFLKNVRMGGLGMHGTLSSEKIDPVNLIKREIKLGVNYSGFSMGYVIPAARRLDVGFDVLLGGGTVNLTLTRSKNSFRIWDSLWTHYGDPTYNESEYTQKLNGTFFAYKFSMNIEYAILDWLGARVGVGYVGMSSPDWKFDDKFELNNVPSAISGKGVSINLGLFAGFFGG